MQITAEPGPKDSLTDIEGLKVGQAEDLHVKTGVTVIVPDAPVAMGVDVRGGGPGTRETDALNPGCLVDKVHGLVLSGGSVFGLRTADRVVQRLSAQDIGLDLGTKYVPVIPSAILFDLKNGGDKDWGDRDVYGQLADTALDRLGTDVAWGRVGAGVGATAGDRPGGLGTASLMTEDGLMVSAIVALNSFGVVTDVAGGAPVTEGTINTPKLGLLGGNTTLAAVATNAILDKAALGRVATMAHDGLARAIRPLHTPFDGDTVFAMATASHESDMPLPVLLTIIGTLAADCLVRAVRRLMV